MSREGRIETGEDGRREGDLVTGIGFGMQEGRE